jgi:hypothetical protein
MRKVVGTLLSNITGAPVTISESDYYLIVRTEHNFTLDELDALFKAGLQFCQTIAGQYVFLKKGRAQ